MSLPFTTEASIPRLRAVHLDKALVERITMTPGLATVVTFPCSIDEAIVGREQDLKVSISQTTKKQLILSLVSGRAQATNLLVRCGDKRDLFVFDIIPSRTTHQDIVKVRAFSGSPLSVDSVSSVIEYSSSITERGHGRKRVFEISKPTLLKEGQ